MAARRDPRRQPFAPDTLPRATKPLRGRPDAPSATPLAIRSRIPLEPDFRDHVRERLGRRLGKFASQIERLTVRFDDDNGPKGGVDVVCRAKAVLVALPTQVVEDRAATPREAFQRVAGALERTVRRTLERAGRSAGRAGRRGAAARGEAAGTRARETGATDREASRARPSRKSTRVPLGRQRGSNPLERTQRLKRGAPRAQAERARVRRKR